MIPLYKLEKLPRTQKLRKIAKVFIMAERRLCGTNNDLSGVFTAGEFAFFSDAAKLLMKDGLFPREAQKLFADAHIIFVTLINTPTTNGTELRRALNSVKHLLLSETGKDLADWDFCPLDYTGSDGSLDQKKRHVFEGMQVYLEDIRSPFNVGAMFRTAESFGVEKIILSPFCADPGHRRAQRTAMGCVGIVPWERQDLFAPQEPTAQEPTMQEPTAQEPTAQEPSPLLDETQGKLPIFALETGGVPIDEFPFPKRGIMIAGSEELGVSPPALAAADASLGRVSIPIYGAKASLNVSTAFGIALQKWASGLG